MLSSFFASCGDWCCCSVLLVFLVVHFIVALVGLVLSFVSYFVGFLLLVTVAFAFGGDFCLVLCLGVRLPVCCDLSTLFLLLVW